MYRLINTEWTRTYTGGERDTMRRISKARARTYAKATLATYAQNLPWRQAHEIKAPVYVCAPCPEDLPQEATYRAVFQCHSPMPAVEDVLQGTWLQQEVSTLCGARLTLWYVSAALYPPDDLISVEAIYTLIHGSPGDSVNLRLHKRTTPATVVAHRVHTLDEISHELETAEASPQTKPTTDPTGPRSLQSNGPGLGGTARPGDGDKATELGGNQGVDPGVHGPSAPGDVRTVLRRRT